MGILPTLKKSITWRVKLAGYKSLELFAYENGLSKSTLSLILNGKRNPKITTLEKIADALNIQFYELFLIPNPAPEGEVFPQMKASTRVKKSKKTKGSRAKKKNN